MALFDFNSKHLNKLKKRAKQIDSLKDEIALLSDEQLVEKTREFQQQFVGITDNAKIDSILDSILNEAFAVCREAAKRVLNQFPHFVQIMGALTLHEGDIAEMKTGEGKTLTATMAVYANALTGRGVHVITVNEYLAKRDAEWMGAIYKFLGLTVGCNYSGLPFFTKKEVYSCDITYSTSSELGFDYLRDNLANNKVQKVLVKGLNFCVMDECDSILIDDARTPLIISGGNNENQQYYQICQNFATSLKENEDYEVEYKNKTVFLTNEGVSKAEKTFNVNLFQIENQNLLHCINNALKANYTMKNDVDYIVKNGKVEIVDQNTGRVLVGRSFSDGIHQAIESKENVKVTSETATVATITYQNFFRLYNKLSGMTGTAKTEEDEFFQVYNMRVIAIPTNKPVIRVDQKDRVFRHEKDKFMAIIEDVKKRHATGQPILIGTISVNTSERLYRLMLANHLSPRLLNAKNDELEASIIAMAGEKGAITLATNMAGRGTDIKLGEGVYELGGLAVIGSERHDARRIDNQLRGRSGRQGDVGCSQFYVSLDDEIFRRSDKKVSNRFLKMTGEITDSTIYDEVDAIQNHLQTKHFFIRKQVLQYDNILSMQQQSIYTLKNKIIDTENVSALENNMYTLYANQLIKETSLDQQKLINSLDYIINDETTIKNSFKGLIKDSEYRDVIVNLLTKKANMTKQIITEERFNRVYKQTILNMINHKYSIHLKKMEANKEGSFYKQYENKNPFTQYTSESAILYEELLLQIGYDSIVRIFKVIEQYANEQLAQQNQIEENKEI